MSGGHPTDADRAARTQPVRERVHAALNEGNGDALARELRSDATWITPDGIFEAEEARRVCAAWLSTVPGAGPWAAPQVKGAHAVFRRGGDTVVVELRRDHVVWGTVATAT